MKIIVYTIRELLLGNLSFDTIHQEIKNILLGDKGFLWDRTYSNQIDSTRCEQLDRVMQILHIGKQGGMVVGCLILSSFAEKAAKFYVFGPNGITCWFY